MTEEPIDPKLSIKFLIKNIRKLIKIRFSNLEKGVKFIESMDRLDEALVPDFEGYGEPMDEGMIYILFNSEGKESGMDIDSVWRIFWVSAPDLNFHQIETFLISEKFSTKKWIRFYDTPIFTSRSKHRFHHETEIDPIHMKIDGIWEEGYTFEFEDRGLKDIIIAGKLQYQPMKNGTLVYYNGKPAISPTMYQQFLDSFGLKVSGDLKIDGTTINVSNARGIIEHGIGIFSTFNIYEWRWLNIQFENGALHLFHHPMQVDEQMVKAGEGALAIDDRWMHILRDDYNFDELEFVDDKRLPTKVPIKWNLKANDGTKELDLTLQKTTHYSWNADAGGDKYFIINYILDVEGTFNGTTLQGKGTMEYLMRRTIE